MHPPVLQFQGRSFGGRRKDFEDIVIHEALGGGDISIAFQAQFDAFNWHSRIVTWRGGGKRAKALGIMCVVYMPILLHGVYQICKWWDIPVATGIENLFYDTVPLVLPLNSLE